MTLVIRDFCTIGISALHLGKDASLSPKQVTDKVMGDATPNKVKNPGPNSPNLLAFIDP